MALTADQVLLSETWLTKHHTQACSACGHRQFSVLDVVSFDSATDRYPVLLVACRQCANVLQFAAVPMGLLPATEVSRG